MHAAESELIFSATDLSNYLACPHLSLLDRKAALGGPKPRQFDDPSVEVLQERGHEHEREVLARIDKEITEIQEGPTAVAETIAAMRRGADVIYQGALRDGPWFGKPDFLIKVDRPSDLGHFSYEVADAKLARSAKGGALLQLLVYACLVESVQGTLPREVHLELGGPEKKHVSFRVSDYIAYFRTLRRRFVDHVESAPEETPYAPDPVEHCQLCDWGYRCDDERRDIDHLSLVADIRRSQRNALIEHGIDTVEKLASLDLENPPPFERMNPASLRKIREQARIQVEGRRETSCKYELLLDVKETHGLAALPPPSPGDLFFDIEGDPYALTYGIEYLFGFTDEEAVYSCDWALSRSEEKRIFEEFIDFVMSRLEQYPGLHVYHFAPYETTAIKALMGRHATREEEVDHLLRSGVFVDLHRIVRQALRASVESYSIKKLEPLYGFNRGVELRNAASALAHFEAWLELGTEDKRDDALLDQIERYNEDDCLSTLRLRNWLEERRDELTDLKGEPVGRPGPPQDEVSEDLSEELAEIAALTAQLTDGLADDPGTHGPEQRARWLLAHLLGFHRRENKSLWWKYFYWRDLTEEELIEDRTTIGGLDYVGKVGEKKRSFIHRYRFPKQEHGLEPGDNVRDPATENSPGTIVEIDDAEGTIDLKRGKASEKPHPRGLLPYEYVPDEVLRESIRRVARAVIADGFGDRATYRDAGDLLTRHAPRIQGETPGAPVASDDEDALTAGRRLVAKLDRSILPIQGPPGSGKTYTGARMIVEALRSGQRVGITGPSHKVISQFLDKVCEAAGDAFEVRGIQNATRTQACRSKQVTATKDNAKIVKALAEGHVHIAAGTAWLWSREDMIGSVELLFIDEAGQFSLADAVAVSAAADSLILLGDPKQLDQPMQGVHPPGADVSSLAHLLDGEPTMPPERGLFLKHTWRLHPSICAFTSESFYAGRLSSKQNQGLDGQRISGAQQIGGAGLRFIPVEHSNNVSESLEEVAAVRRLVDELLRCTWTNRNGCERPLEVDDILIVAPYNTQVSLLAAALPKDARVGTVDKFQGQEAPVVVYSMATSSAEEAPRGMDFLFSSNRLNVATSRAQALAIIVANPALFEPECRTPEQMKLANAFCRFREIADLPLGAGEHDSAL